MSPAAVTARLRTMSELSNLRYPQRARVDMSSAAVTARLREMSQLLALQLMLARGRPSSPTHPRREPARPA